MDNFEIFTDTGCDIVPEKLDEWNVRCIDLLFRDVKTDKVYTQRQMPVDIFYQKMKDGDIFRTSAANMDDFIKNFEPVLQEGRDILYIGFSSGLSGTVSTGAIVANELMEKYPERKIIVVDTLCASAGLGMFVYMAVLKRAKGESMEDIAAYIRENVPYLGHWFTVGDLVYLKRSGRCSAAAAFMGGMLNLKPLLHVDEEGHLVPIVNVRGRKKSIAAVADKYFELARDPENGMYFICNGDCREDAQKLEEMIMARNGGKKADLITDIGPVIGSHSGPGTLAVFFLGKQR